MDMDEYEKAIQRAQMQTDAINLSQQQQELQNEQGEMTIVAQQLELGDVLTRMDHLLRGHVLKYNEVKGKSEWVRPDNNDMIILTEHGVNYIMWMLQAYLTKNTLLSNYDDNQIAAKMEDFSTTLADDIFMEYDKMFLYPTLDDCKEEITRRLTERADKKIFARQLIGEEVNEDEQKKIVDELRKEMEGKIDKELETIRQQKIKNKLKRFESLLRMVQDTVHSAYQRAWKGQERSTLRTHMHITETKGGMIAQKPHSGFNPLGAWKRN